MAAGKNKKIDEGQLTGAQKSAIVLMSVEEDIAAKVFNLMNEEEIREISQTMANLGSVDPIIIDNLIKEFSEQMSIGGNLIGDLSSAQRLLTAALGAEKVAGLLDDISGPTGRNTWDKLNNVSEELLASYLKNEYPQTAALVLSKIRSSQAARVLSVFPEEFALEVIQRMITMEPVKTEVLKDIERTLQSEFMSNLSSAKQTDSYEMIAEVFNNFDRNTENKFLGLLDESEPEASERIRELMFTFDDLMKIDDTGVQAILRGADKDQLAIALKGASDTIREHFFNNMSERAAKIMKEDMESKGPVRMKDVDAAQLTIVNTAKELADKGEIVIPEGDDENEEMVY